MNTEMNCENIIDIRDIIERIEDLETKQEEGEYTETPDCELTHLRSIMEELKGNGGDEQWRGDWYPVTLVRDDHFTDYVAEMLEDCGEIPRNLPSYIEINWEATARNIRMDYTNIEIDGISYWYR